MKKFELTEDYILFREKKVFRIKALTDFGNVKAGELGGYVEKEEDLAHEGNAWVAGNARIVGDTRVGGDAWVGGDVWVTGNARIVGDACVEGNARIAGNACVEGNARVGGDAWVGGDALVAGNARIVGDACVEGNARVTGNARVGGDAWVGGDARVAGDALISSDEDYACVKGFGSECRNTTFFRCEDATIKVSCGCFFGTLEEFREKVVKTHGETKFAKEYLMIADLMEMHFEEGKE